MHRSHHAPGRWWVAREWCTGRSDTNTWRQHYISSAERSHSTHYCWRPELHQKGLCILSRQAFWVHGRHFGQIVVFVWWEAAHVVTSGPADEKLASTSAAGPEKKDRCDNDDMMKHLEYGAIATMMRMMLPVLHPTPTPTLPTKDQQQRAHCNTPGKTVLCPPW
jgi:hypothetical protein